MAKMLPSASWPASRTLGLNWSAYGSAATCSLMSASWPCSMSDLPSVNGIVKTSGSVPPASWAANVGPVHSYSSDTTSISGFASSNWATCSSNASKASGSLPGRRLTTVSVTCPAPSEAGADAGGSSVSWLGALLTAAPPQAVTMIIVVTSAAATLLARRRSVRAIWFSLPLTCRISECSFAGSDGYPAQASWLLTSSASPTGHRGAAMPPHPSARPALRSAGC